MSWHLHRFEADSLIPFDQIDAVFNGYRGEKEMYFIEESHN